MSGEERVPEAREEGREESARPAEPRPIPLWKRAFTSDVWILIAAAAAVAFAIRGVSLILFAERRQAEFHSLSALIERFDSLEGAIHEFELGITPAEFLAGSDSGASSGPFGRKER